MQEGRREIREAGKEGLKGRKESERETGKQTDRERERTGEMGIV